MKKLYSKLKVNERVLNIIRSMALFFAVYASNSRCLFCFHEPEFPAEIKKLRKF